MLKSIRRYRKMIKFIRRNRKAGRSKFIVLTTGDEFIMYSDQDDKQIIRFNY